MGENNEMEKAQDSTAEKIELDGRPLRILVTDDSKLLRKKLRLELENTAARFWKRKTGKKRS